MRTLRTHSPGPTIPRELAAQAQRIPEPPARQPGYQDSRPAPPPPGRSAADYKHGPKDAQRPNLADMQVIVRLQDRGALRLDHLHDQALCEPEGRGALLITHIMPMSGRWFPHDLALVCMYRR
jgi:hypothetical protein